MSEASGVDSGLLLTPDTGWPSLQGRVALVSGGSQGIGLAAGRGLAQAGATVVLLGRDPDRAHESARALVDEGLDAVGVSADVGDAESVQAALAPLGPLAAVDVLVNSAGISGPADSKTLRVSARDWRAVLAVNLDGAFHLSSALVPGMIERRWGRVVNVSACLGRFTGPGLAGGLAPYRVSKAALNAFTRNLAAETLEGRRGVLVDAVCPGHCRTQMGGDAAPRSAERGAETIMWLATRAQGSGEPASVPTGLLWEDGQQVPW